jgi:hypothetical protein
MVVESGVTGGDPTCARRRKPTDVNLSRSLHAYLKFCN